MKRRPPRSTRTDTRFTYTTLCRSLMKIDGDDMTAIASVFSMGASGKSNRTSVKDRVSPEEWQTRVNLALCYRLIAHFGLTDGIYNHISCRVPGDEEHVLLNPFGLLYEEITASNLDRKSTRLNSSH